MLCVLAAHESCCACLQHMSHVSYTTACADEMYAHGIPQLVSHVPSLIPSHRSTQLINYCSHCQPNPKPETLLLLPLCSLSSFLLQTWKPPADWRAPAAVGAADLQRFTTGLHSHTHPCAPWLMHLHSQHLTRTVMLASDAPHMSLSDVTCRIHQ